MIKNIIFLLISITCTLFSQVEGNAIRFKLPGDFVKIDFHYPTNHIFNEMWFRADSLPTATMLSVSAFGIGEPEQRDSHYEVSIDSSGRLIFRVRVTIPTTQWVKLVGTSTVAIGEWHHVYVAFSNGDKFEIWLDGLLDASSNGHEFRELGKILQVPPLLTIATSFEDGNSDFVFRGSLDEIRIWDIYRDSLQVRATMYDTLTSEYYASADSGLAGYWRIEDFEDLGMNGDGDDDLRDLSFRLRHGDTYGNPELVQSDPSTGVRAAGSYEPGRYSLNQNYPNPFNPETHIEFDVARNLSVTLKIYDIRGREVTTLVDQRLPPGHYKKSFDARGLASGVYLYKLRIGDYRAVKKMILMR